MTILSNRTLKFYNNETVYEIDLKQTAFGNKWYVEETIGVNFYTFGTLVPS